MNKQLLTNTPKSPLVKAKRLFELQQIMKEIKPEMDELKADLLKVTQDLDVYTLKTGTYTISRGKRVTPRVENFETLKKTLDERQIPYELVTAFSKNMLPVFQEFIKHGEELDGLDGQVTEYISIRIAKEK